MDDQIENKENKYKCELCNKEHSLTEEGFVVNKKIQHGLDIQLNTVKLSLKVYDECKKEIEEANENVSQIEKDLESYIYEYFFVIKRQVDLRREDPKL